jgi:hypothetical protein
VLRCTELHDTPVIFLPTPLAIVNFDQNRPRVTRQNMWRGSLEWIRECRKFVTRRAYAAFLANFLAPQASDEKASGAFFILLYEMFRYGSPRLRELCVFLGAWLLPVRLRGNAGILIAAGNPTEYARAIQGILDNPALAARLISLARSRSSQFQLDTMVSGYEQLFAKSWDLANSNASGGPIGRSSVEISHPIHTP